MTEKVTRMRIVLDIGAEETLVGVGAPELDPTLVQIPVGLSAGLEAVLKAALQVATQSPDASSREVGHDLPRPPLCVTLGDAHPYNSSQ